MSSLLSKVIKDLAPAEAFHLPKCGGLSSKWLPPLWASLVIHQLLIPLAHHRITWLFLGKWASVAQVKWNSLLQSDHSSKLQFELWNTITYMIVLVILKFISTENISVFSDWQCPDYFQKSCYKYKGNNYPRCDFFFIGVCPAVFPMLVYTEFLASPKTLSYISC